MSEIHASLSFNLDIGLIQAALPLFEGEEVEGLEWSFDTLFQHAELPEWFQELLQTYSEAGRLVGHGVFFSLFSGKWLPEQAAWLQELRDLTQRFRFDHISEHFGFLTGSDFHKGAPLSVPYNVQALAVGRDRLTRIAEACGCPVGLENLAFASSTQAAKVHGEFLEALLTPVNGFVILDLHNLYCQLHNFGLDADDMLAAFPLARVREIHISGGSWEPSAHRPHPGVRRDTHDERVPEEVFALLVQTMPRCPNLKFVVLEHMGIALTTDQEQIDYRDDFRRMQALVHAEQARRNMATHAPTTNLFLPPTLSLGTAPLEDPTLHHQQQILSGILETSDSLAAAQLAIQHSALADTDWDIATWDPAMLETARLIARKWRDGF
jgi:uncharacterized protein